MKRNNVRIAIVLVTMFAGILTSCEDSTNDAKGSSIEKHTSINEPDEKSKHRYTEDSLFGKWRFTEIQFRRFEDDTNTRNIESGLISRESIRDRDSIVINLKRNGKLDVNNKQIGDWDLESDKLTLKGKARLEGIPLFLNVAYDIGSDKYCKYLTCTFFNQNRMHHQVRYTILKL